MLELFYTEILQICYFSRVEVVKIIILFIIYHRIHALEENIFLYNFSKLHKIFLSYFSSSVRISLYVSNSGKKVQQFKIHSFKAFYSIRNLSLCKASICTQRIKGYSTFNAILLPIRYMHI